MAVDVTPGTGKTVAADVVGSAHTPSAGEQVQYVKLDIGAAGATSPVTAANPLRTDPTGSTTQPVSAASLPLPSGASTDATVAAGNTLLTTINGKITAVNTGAVTISAALPTGANTVGGVTLPQYTPVSGRLPVDGSGVTQPVSGTFFQATQPVSIAATVAVSGTFFQATQPVSAAALPLPSGAAAEATLSALNAKVTAVNTGATVLAAGTALAAKVYAYQVAGEMLAPGGTALTVKRARVTITTATAAQIVAAVASRYLFVLGYTLQSTGGNTPLFHFEDDTGTPVVLSRDWKLDATGAAGVNGVSVPVSPFGAGVDPTSIGKKLMGKLDTTGSVTVEVTYVELP